MSGVLIYVSVPKTPRYAMLSVNVTNVPCLLCPHMMSEFYPVRSIGLGKHGELRGPFSGFLVSRLRGVLSIGRGFFVTAFWIGALPGLRVFSSLRVQEGWASSPLDRSVGPNKTAEVSK